MFAIGDKEWPGISKLIEEAGEVLQTCGKLIATGGNIEHWDDEGVPLHTRLENELADLQAAINFVIAYNSLLRADRVNARAERKLTRFETWHAQGEANKRPRCGATTTVTSELTRTTGRCILMAGHEGSHQL